MKRNAASSSIVSFSLAYKSEYLKLINPFHANALFLYPLKRSENLLFSDVFRGYRNRTLT